MTLDNPDKEDARMDTNVDHIRIITDHAGEYRWTAIAGNGEPVSQGESHPEKHDAIRAARGVFGDAVEIRDETDEPGHK